MKVECWQNYWISLLHSVILIDANVKVLLSLQLLNLPVLLDWTWSELLSSFHHGYRFPC